MNLIHLTSSTFFGGPERQMLGLAEFLPAEYFTTFVSFSEGGRCAEFLGMTEAHGFRSIALHHDTPDIFSAIREVTEIIRDNSADVLLCHGYKAAILGRIAARRAGIPVIGVSRGWTGESFKVRLYEKLDRWNLHHLDQVVCVSEGQAEKVRRTGLPEAKLRVIRNSARPEAFRDRTPAHRQQLLWQIPTPVQRVVVGAGRLSPEKGFDVLIEAAALFLEKDPKAGLVIFGEGPERAKLEARCRELAVRDRIALPGFSRQLDQLLPCADVVVLPSHTEGLPNIALEASAACVPVVATAVGGTPEVVRDKYTGYLVPPGNPQAMALRISTLLEDQELRSVMGFAGREWVRKAFSFQTQAADYIALFEELVPRSTVLNFR